MTAWSNAKLNGAAERSGSISILCSTIEDSTEPGLRTRLFTHMQTRAADTQNAHILRAAARLAQSDLVHKAEMTLTSYATKLKGRKITRDYARTSYDAF